MRVLVVNGGSSSLKLALLDGGDRTIAECELPAPRAVVDEDQLRVRCMVVWATPTRSATESCMEASATAPRFW